ncbi:DUF2510 domain-containing protein [Actinacidiphila sp. bgisy160]|uniref:DUF2510 domain-containing protein n=1 Tax=Actinacidiphila sp. bgisy160 TaxID=3413796 RepID=UPI003D735ED5
MTTPPGWYPEPGQTGNGPALERWWDGTEWTEYTRTAQPPAPAFGAPGTPGAPPYPADVLSGGGGGGRRGGVIAIAVVAALVVVGAVIGGVVALNRGGDAPAAAPGPSASAPHPDSGDGGPDGGPGGGPSPAPDSEPGFAVDALDGISVPVPDGWQGTTDRYGRAALTVGPYACPGDSSRTCVRGGVTTEPAYAAGIKATTPKAAATEDIARNAAESYGDEIYGAITSHEVTGSGAVTVAGQKGYYVRWKVVTKNGDDGHVQSLVFPSPKDPGKLVLVRYGFDVNPKAPGLAVMDEITKGIKASGSAGGTGV